MGGQRRVPPRYRYSMGLCRALTNQKPRFLPAGKGGTLCSAAERFFLPELVATLSAFN